MQGFTLKVRGQVAHIILSEIFIAGDLLEQRTGDIYRLFFIYPNCLSVCHFVCICTRFLIVMVKSAYEPSGPSVSVA